MTWSSIPSARSMIGPAFSLLPNMEVRRERFAAMFTATATGYDLLHKGQSYALSERQHARCLREFEEIVAEVRARFLRFIIQTLAGSLIAIPVYFTFVDSLLSMLPEGIQTAIDTFVTFQPLLWAVALAVWQERKIAASVNAMADRMAWGSSSTSEDVAQYRTDQIGSIVTQTVLAAVVVLLLFGSSIF